MSSSLPDISQYNWIELQDLREAVRQRLLTQFAEADAYNIPRAIDLARLASEFLSQIERHNDFHILELGSGHFNPHALGFLFYLNGYPKITATDWAQIYNPSMAARWMYEAALHAIAFPEKWLLTQADKNLDLLKRISSRAHDLPLSALAEGKFESIEEIQGQPFRYVRLLEERDRHVRANYDYIYSIAVLEHIMDLPKELAWQYDLLRSGGGCFAFFDLRDHRFHDDPQKFFPWSFMLDGIYGPDSLIRPDLQINGLRSSQVRRLAEAAGFKIEKWEEQSIYEIPADLAKRVRPEFQSLPLTDITTFRVKAMMRKSNGN